MGEGIAETNDGQENVADEVRIRDEMFGDYRVLFDLTKKVKPEDIEMVRAFLERITNE